MKERNIKISIILNIIIVIMTAFASFAMFTGFKFMEGKDLLESTMLGMFRFFTVDSNLLMGIASLIFLVLEIKVINGKETEISKNMYILKLMATSAVTLTFITVVAYLAPISEGGFISMIQNSNLFFHLLIPVLSIITFVFFEKTDKMSLKCSILGVIPMALYSIYYTINILVHLENGKVEPLYDWYWFVQGGLWQMAIVIPIMFIVTYLISFLLWKFNKVKRR